MPKAVVCTCSYADVLAGDEATVCSDVEMADSEMDSNFEPRIEEKDKMTDDNAESTVILLLLKKKELKRGSKAQRMGCHQDSPG
jgi:hypothetical protein